MKLIALQDIGVSTGSLLRGQSFTDNEVHGEQLIGSGHARLDDGRPIAWDGIQWPGATVAVLASGPSLTMPQCEAVQAWRGAGAQRRVIVVNTTFKRAPWADVLYACDAPWWNLYIDDVLECFTGQLWTQDERAMREHRVNLIRSVRLPGLGKRPGLIHQGGNSGYQAINLAYQAGATRIILLGFDHHGTHWHGKYENGLPNPSPHLMGMWLNDAAPLAADLAAAGVQVLNCSPGSALTCFPVTDLSEALA